MYALLVTCIITCIVTLLVIYLGVVSVTSLINLIHNMILLISVYKFFILMLFLIIQCYIAMVI